MAAKVEVTDIEKLNPDLLSKSAAQLEREITERKMALDEIKRREEEKARQAKLDEASERIDRILDDLRWLESNAFLSENLKAKFASKDKAGGAIFAPHLSFRKPK